MIHSQGTITVVSGLPRSGTSMMMKMLEAGGMEVLTDYLRAADHDNPQGYYEFERVKQLPKGDYAWLEEARGKVVKVISALLEYLPSGYTYHILFMHRDMEEILASQRKMLHHRQEPTDRVSDEEMARLFQRHVTKVLHWLHTQPHMAVLQVNYNHLLADPHPHLQEIIQFLNVNLHRENMLRAIDPNLYRNRKAP